MDLHELSYFLCLECKVVLKNGHEYFGQIDYKRKDGQDYLVIDNKDYFKLDEVQNVFNLKS